MWIKRRINGIVHIISFGSLAFFSACLEDRSGSYISPSIEFSKEHNFFIHEYEVIDNTDLSNRILEVFLEQSWLYVLNRDLVIVWYNEPVRAEGYELVIIFQDRILGRYRLDLQCYGVPAGYRGINAYFRFDSLLTRDTLTLTYNDSTQVREFRIVKKKNDK